MELSRKTENIVNILFGRDDANEVKRLLKDHCSNNVPGCRDWPQESLERIWLSVLKVSNGNIGELRKAIALANTDYRDLFMSAGFGHDVKAHKNWRP